MLFSHVTRGAELWKRINVLLKIQVLLVLKTRYTKMYGKKESKNDPVNGVNSGSLGVVVSS